MFQVPQRATALYDRDCFEVVFRRRRVSGPFERPRIPGIASSVFPPEVRPKEIADEGKDACSLEEDAEGDNQIPDVPSTSRLVGVDAARHPEHAGNMHEIERQMKTDEEKQEVKFGERFAVHPSWRIGKPIVELPKQREVD